MRGRTTIQHSVRRRRPAEARRAGIPHLIGILIGIFFVVQAGFMVSLFRMADPPPEPEEEMEEAVGSEAGPDEREPEVVTP